MLVKKNRVRQHLKREDAKHLTQVEHLMEEKARLERIII